VASRQSPAASLGAHGYQVIKQLSGGTSATVLLVCFEGRPSERFVVKTFGLGDLDPSGKRAVAQEISLLRRLKHPHIISYVENWWNGVGPNSGRFTVVMEYAEDGDLRAPHSAAVNSGSRIHEVVIKRWLRQMLEGLAHIHGNSIIHRDLKAMNVFLKGGWRTCLVGDFGISTVLKSVSDAVTGCVGTPAYMSPELVWNERYSIAVDLWALGVILYEMMALRLPFKADSLLGMVYQIAFSTHDETPLRKAGYSEAMVSLTSRLMAKDPAARPGAAELLGDAALWEGLPEDGGEEMAAQAYAAAQLFASKGATTGFALPGDADSSAGPATSRSCPGSSTYETEDWGDAMRLSVDSITGLAKTSNSEKPFSDSCDDGTLPAFAAEAANTVSDKELWTELHQTRTATDVVVVDQFEALMNRLRSKAAAAKGSDADLPGHERGAGDSCLNSAVGRPPTLRSEDVRGCTPVARDGDKDSTSRFHLRPVTSPSSGFGMGRPRICRSEDATTMMRQDNVSAHRTVSEEWMPGTDHPVSNANRHGIQAFRPTTSPSFRASAGKGEASLYAGIVEAGPTVGAKAGTVEDPLSLMSRTEIFLLRRGQR